MIGFEMQAGLFREFVGPFKSSLVFCMPGALLPHVKDRGVTAPAYSASQPQRAQ